MLEINLVLQKYRGMPWLDHVISKYKQKKVIPSQQHLSQRKICKLPAGIDLAAQQIRLRCKPTGTSQTTLPYDHPTFTAAGNRARSFTHAETSQLDIFLVEKM